MKMPKGSTRVVYAALAGNLLVAGAKYVAAALSGSSAMLTEAIHSSADSVNQILLLVGNQRSKARSDETHNFGYGPEIYFWTFVVAVLVLLVGGVLSIAQGLHQLQSPRPVDSVPLSVVVLLVSAVFEGASFLVGQRETQVVIRRHARPGITVGFWQFIRLSKDPNLYESQLEDGAALIGVGIALVGVLGNGLLGWLWADGAASCAIGLLLVADAIVILSATRSLIAGEAATPIIQEELAAAVRGQHPKVAKVETLHLGPECILVTLTLAEGAAAAADPHLPALVDKVRAVDGRIEHVLFRP
jgi:cation diffusion facilitator family transporter